MLDLKPTPLNVTQEAALKMPRFLLLALLTIFILSGLFGRDLWSSAESRLLAEVVSIDFTDPASWLFPFASGEIITEQGPLPGWIGAIFTTLFGSLVGELRAMRLSSILWFAISTSCIWYGTWFLARRREAQPVEQAFARQAQYRDFGRLMADAATLFFISLSASLSSSTKPFLKQPNSPFPAPPSSAAAGRSPVPTGVPHLQGLHVARAFFAPTFSSAPPCWSAA